METTAPWIGHRAWSPGISAALAVLLVLGGLAFGAPLAHAAGPTTFANTTAVAIPGTGTAGKANPYPSAIDVTGLSGVISKITVTLRGMTHSSLSDVDVMVVSPSGANLVVLSDIREGALSTISAQDLTFDDAAASAVPAQVVVPGGTYRPTNTGGGDTFDAPAPAPSTQTTLAGAFSGLSPNGTWRLYVMDDADGDTGRLAGGWSLTITTDPVAATTTTAIASSDVTSTTGDPVTFTATVRAGGAAVTTGTVQFSVDGTNTGVAWPPKRSCSPASPTNYRPTILVAS